MTTIEPPRPAARRKADALAALSAPAADVWVATAAGDRAHLVPLSLAWVEERVVLAVADDSATARNLTASGRARLGVWPTRDVVMLDAELEATHPVPEAPEELAAAYAAQADWDPREDGEGYLYLVLRPTRVQAWREANELRGRTLMRDGAWLV
jgi:hypothetical protein